NRISFIVVVIIVNLRPVTYKCPPQYPRNPATPIIFIPCKLKAGIPRILPAEYSLLVGSSKPFSMMKRKDAQLIEKIRDYLDENLYEEHSIQGLCVKFTINREKLQAGFHALVNSTVHAYIVRQRIDRAAQRLLESDDSIKAIALDSGYKKQRSFN